MVDKTTKLSRYQLRKGAHLSKEDGEKLVETIEHIQAEGQPLVPQALVEYAKPKRSPIHHLFEWDDSEAARLHRLNQARQHIGAIVQIDISTRKPGRAAYSIQIDKGKREYKMREEVVASDSAITQVSWDLYRRCVAAVNEAESLGLFATDPAWSRIGAAVRTTEPLSMDPQKMAQ